MDSRNIIKESIEIEAGFREPYLQKGYRLPGCSLRQCLRYTVILHNDSINFWTHFIPFLVWAIELTHQLITRPWLSDSFWHPMLCLKVGFIVMAFSSSVAHTFCILSLRARHLVFMLDYASISQCSLGLVIASLHYPRPIFGSGVPVEISVIAACFSSLLVTVVTCLTRFLWTDKSKPLIRNLAYLPFTVLTGVMLMARYYLEIRPRSNILSLEFKEDFTSVMFNRNSVFFHFLGFLLLLLAAGFYSSKFPEKLNPGKFDIVGHSHQFFHIIGACSVHFFKRAFEMDGSFGWNTMQLLESNKDDISFTTVFYFMFSLIGNLLIVFLIGLVFLKKRKIS